MKKFKCLYCQSIIINNNLESFNYECKNHKKYVLFTVDSNNLIFSILFRDLELKLELDINIYNSRMHFWTFNYHDKSRHYSFVKTFPLDKHITPENFEERIENYLLFA
jgi:hypothetical protein